MRAAMILGGAQALPSNRWHHVSKNASEPRKVWQEISRFMENIEMKYDGKRPHKAGLMH